MALGSRSMPVRTVAPVVVSPEMDSNRASMGRMSSCGERISGSAPKEPSTVQNSTTTRKPSRSRSSRRCDLTGSHNTMPVIRVTAKAQKKGSSAPSA